MFKLPFRKLLFIVKLGLLFVLVLITLSLFEYWRGGKRATRAYVLDSDEEIFEKQILEDEARIIHGLGEGGRPAYLTGEDKRLGEEAEKKYALNTYLSDRIAYNRTLKDFRNPACQRVTYDAELPSTSVIIIFHNEPYSVVIRTIWSVLNTARRDQPWHRQANYLERGTGRVMKLGYPGQAEDSEYVYLKEIILVDDNSTLPELRGKLARYVRTRLPPDMVRVLRLPDRIGLTRARLAGARYARGDVLIFLDAHCEGVTDWMRPLLQRIKDSPTAVVMPIIDVVEHKDFFYSVQDPAMFQIGGFTFVGHFTWIDIPEREKRRRGSDIAPTWSPTMAGGLFAIRRAYYWELGAYDEQMAGWGGENLEMSFRIWQCGGTLETIPCSRVGHVFRAFHPYGLPANTDTHGINTARMAEVWMDDYAELFYLHRPDLRKSPLIGDVTHRKVLREKLHCKSFQWYLDNVYREKYVPVRDSAAFGRVQNPATRLCLDTMQREGEAAPLGFYPCHSRLTDTQHLSLSLAGQLRDEERCAEVQFRRAEESLDDDVARAVVMVTCRDNTAKMQWRHLPGTGQLQHVGTELCLDARRARAGGDARARTCAREATPSQRWAFDYEGDDTKSGGAGAGAGAGVLPPDLEQVLNKIRGHRRKSRSLLSVNEETGDARGTGAGDMRGTAAGDGGHTGAAPPSARRHRERRRRSKKIHKNKFIVTIERTLSNSSVEHLEMDIHCKHRRLYPNNTFVRDLVSILNDRDIRVINNGRVFEKNKVIDLDKERSLRQPEDKARTTQPPPERERDDESTEASTEKQVTTPARAQPDAEVAPAHAGHHDTTDKPKITLKKRRHKKKHSSSKYEKKRPREHSLLLSDHDEDHVAIGSGGNGTGVLLPTEPSSNARARETGAEWERDGAPVDSRSGRDRGRHHWPNERMRAATPRPDSSELRLGEDRAQGDFKEIEIRGGELDAAREEARHAAKGGGEGGPRRHKDRSGRGRGRGRGPGDPSRELDPGRGLDPGRERGPDARARARAAAIARHAELHPLKLAGDAAWLDAGKGKRTEEERAASRDRYVSRAAKGDDASRHKDGSVRRLASDDSSQREHKLDANNIELDLGLDKTIWPEADAEADKGWDPWAPAAPAVEATDARKAGRGSPHSAVERLVYGDAWDAPTPAPADPRVSALAQEVMMEYGELTEEPVPRVTSRETVTDGSSAARSKAGAGGSGAARGAALRVRLKSNMTFNLGDELLSWRRMQMTGQESESGSPSDEADRARANEF